MPWLLTSPGHQQPWYWLCRICRFLSYYGRMLSTCIISMWSNDIKCKYMFMLLLNNLARKGLRRFYQIPWMLCSPAPQIPGRSTVRSAQITLCPHSVKFRLIPCVIKAGTTFLSCSHVWMREDKRDTESKVRTMRGGGTRCLGGLSWLGWLTYWNK